jgi:hypothetical protein
VLLVCTEHSELYSEIALSRKQFGIGHMYKFTFLLRITDTMTSPNIDISSWDTLYIRVYKINSIDLLTVYNMRFKYFFYVANIACLNIHVRESDEQEL